jgi:hypothetical protein
MQIGTIALPVALALAARIAFAAAAGEPEPTPARRPFLWGPCAAEVQKFCKDVEPGAGRIRACLQSHEAELSKACQAHLKRPPAARMGRPGQAPMRACAPDIQKLCKGVQPGGGRIVQCLREHESELSQACKAVVTARAAGAGAAPAAPARAAAPPGGQKTPPAQP